MRTVTDAGFLLGLMYVNEFTYVCARERVCQEFIQGSLQDSL